MAPDGSQKPAPQLLTACRTWVALFDHDEGPLWDDLDRLKIVFVDGVFDANASDDLTLEGMQIERLADVARMDIHWAKDLLGVLEFISMNQRLLM